VTDMGETGRVLPSPGEGQAPEIRIADHDREIVIGHLRTAVGEGRITLDEFADRAGQVYAARIVADLQRVITDLPVVAPIPTPTPQSPMPEVDVSGAPVKRRRQRIVAIMSGRERRGRWRVGPKLSAFAWWGGVKLDLRGALLESTEIEITATAIMGGIDILVPEGIPVDMDGFVLMGGADNRVRDAPALPGAPRITVRVRGLWGGISVRSRTQREAMRDVRREAHERRAEREAQRAGRRMGPPLPPLPPMPHAPHVPAPPTPPIPPPPPMPHTRSAPVAEDHDLDDLADDVRRDAPDLSKQAAPDGTVTILFSDIEGSAGLAERLGDHRWLDLLREHNRIVREQIGRSGGTEVKAEGDGFMVVFSSARRAVLCAIGVQQAMAMQRRLQPDLALHVRIGLHTGEVLREDGDFFGKHVILAARIASEAKGGEILASSLVKELTESGGDLGFDDGREVELRGLSRTYRVYAVDWHV